MNLQRYWLAAGLFLLLTAGAAAAVLTGKGNTVQAARETVKEFCQDEFEGGEPETRERLVRFGPEREAEFQKYEHPWIAKYLAAPQRVVVGAYDVQDVRVEGKRATAVVVYQRLASTKDSYNGLYLLDKKDNDLVTLNLVYAKKKWWALKGQWWVLDPPPLRVSKRVMVEYYELELKWYVDRKKEIGELPEHQQDAYDRKSGILRFLKSLP